MKTIKSVNPLQLAIHNVHNGDYDHISIPNNQYCAYPAEYLPTTGKGMEYVISVQYRGIKKVVCVYETDKTTFCTEKKVFERLVP